MIQLEKETIGLKEFTKPGLDSTIGRISSMDYIINKSINKSQLSAAESKIQALKNWQQQTGYFRLWKIQSMC
ncbi:MAG TPA: hypothetical protein VK921_13915 [Anditalea sp.]|nr:hypothetical protein [Anditalea sp.]